MAQIILEEQMREERWLLWLRGYSDRVVGRLRNESLSEAEALEILQTARQKILTHFPGKEREYEMIYDRRFKRVLLACGHCPNLGVPGDGPQDPD